MKKSSFDFDFAFDVPDFDGLLDDLDLDVSLDDIDFDFDVGLPEDLLSNNEGTVSEQ